MSGNCKACKNLGCAMRGTDWTPNPAIKCFGWMPHTNMVCPKCGSELDALVYTTYPPVYAYRCRNCGWEHEERTNITQVPVEPVADKADKEG